MFVGLTGLPFGPSSPGGPLAPAGPAAPGGPASPFSPLSPLGPCRNEVRDGGGWYSLCQQHLKRQRFSQKSMMDRTWHKAERFWFWSALGLQMDLNGPIGCAFQNNQTFRTKFPHPLKFLVLQSSYILVVEKQEFMVAHLFSGGDCPGCPWTLHQTFDNQLRKEHFQCINKNMNFI